MSIATAYRTPAFATAALIAAVALAACQSPEPPAAASSPNEPVAAQVTPDTSEKPARSTDVPTPDEPAPSAETMPAAFIDKVWKVKESSAVEPGTTYTFLSDGTLVIDSPNGTPMRGKWTFQAGALTMIEEGVSYPAQILKLDAGEFRIRSHNPGEPVDIVLEPAPQQPLPKAGE